MKNATSFPAAFLGAAKCILCTTFVLNRCDFPAGAAKMHFVCYTCTEKLRLSSWSCQSALCVLHLYGKVAPCKPEVPKRCKTTQRKKNDTNRYQGTRKKGVVFSTHMVLGLENDLKLSPRSRAAHSLPWSVRGTPKPRSTRVPSFSRPKHQREGAALSQHTSWESKLTSCEP